MKNLKIQLILIASVLAFTSCSKDDEVAQQIPPAVNEEELITTVTAVFTPQGGGPLVTLQSKDLDGDGPGIPIITVSSSFNLNKTYDGSITILNESKTPADDITIEVADEGLDHQLFYQKTGTLPVFNYSTATNNLDANGKPIGLKTIFVTTTAATGSLKITLRHLPNKYASGVSDGDITNAGGATDFEVTFSGLIVQ